MDGFGLWKSDGTPAATNLVKDVILAARCSFPHELANVNGTPFFMGDNRTNGYELWKTDGTTGGTVLVKGLNPGGGVSSEFGALANIDGTLFLRAYDPTNGNELWKTRPRVRKTKPRIR